MTNTNQKNLDSDLDASLDEFLADYLVNKTCLLTEEEAKRYPLLLSNGLIEKREIAVDGRSFQFNPPDAFIAKLATTLSAKKSFSFSNDIAKIVEFVDEVYGELSSQDTQGLYAIIQRLTAYLISNAEEAGASLCSFMSTLGKADNHFWSLLILFSDRLVFAHYPVDDMWRALRTIALEIGRPNDFDGAWSQIAHSLVQHITKHPEDGRCLYKNALHDPENKELGNLALACLRGLTEARVCTLPELITKLDAPDEQVAAAVVLSSVAMGEEETVTQVLDKLDAITSFEKPFIFQITRLLAALDRVRGLSEPTTKRIEERLVGLLQSADEETTINCFATLCAQEEITPLLSRLIKEFAASDNFQDRHAHITRNIFQNHKDFDLFFELVRIVANKQTLRFNPEAFEYSVALLRNNDATAFDERLVKLVIDDEGACRFAGIRLLGYTSSGSMVGQSLGYDVLQLTAVQQYQFCVALPYSTMQPKEMLTFLLPLRHTLFPIVQELLCCKIEELITDYGKTVIEVLEELLDASIPVDREILKRATSFEESHSEHLQSRYQCKELSSRYCQAKLMREYNKQYQVQMRQLHETAEDKSLLRLFGSTIMLARGGGWKHGKDNSVQNLSSISTTMQMARSLLKNPDKANRYHTEFFRHNWKEEYQKWEQIISSLPTT